jgi:hypothetical protein
MMSQKWCHEVLQVGLKCSAKKLHLRKDTKAINHHWVNEKICVPSFSDQKCCAGFLFLNPKRF